MPPKKKAPIPLPIEMVRGPRTPLNLVTAIGTSIVWGVLIYLAYLLGGWK